MATDFTTTAAANDASHDVLHRPVVIIGAPRSGTSLLTRTLGSHPAVLLLMEPRLVWRFGNDAKSDMLSPDDARPEIIEHIRNTFADRVRAASKSRLVEKTPANALRPGFVDRVLPDARFIHIIRDPVQSVLAIRSFWLNHSTGYKIAPGRVMQRLKEAKLRQLPHYGKEILRRSIPKFMSKTVGRNLWGPRLPGMQQMLSEIDLLEVCALQWRMCVEQTATYCRKLPAERYYECKLEDLSHEHLENMLHFAELGDDPAVHAFFRKEFDPSRIGARKAQAQPGQIERILDLTHTTRSWLGYTDS